MQSATSSPALSAFNGSPLLSARHSAKSRQPNLHQVNTAFPQAFTLTPASARSVSSTAASPYITSLQSSPDSLQSIDPSHLPSPVPLELPEAIIVEGNVPQSSPSKDQTTPNKSSTLSRKISQKANRVGQRLRRKASSTYQEKREESIGPIIRRRSDSKTTTYNSTSNAASSVDLAALHADQVQAYEGHFSNFTDATSMISEPSSVLPGLVLGSASALPDRLLTGVKLTKITRNNSKKPLEFFLNPDGSKVSWNTKKPSKSFFIDDITEIRSRTDLENVSQMTSPTTDEAGRSFTILYTTRGRSKDVKSLRLIAPSKADLRLWVSTLEALLKHRSDLMTGLSGSVGREHIIKSHWDTQLAKQDRSGFVDAGQGTLDLVAIETLCQHLHITCSKSTIREQFNLADSKHVGSLNWHEFNDFVRRLRERKDIMQIFNKLIGSEKGLSKTKFFEFLELVQKVDVFKHSTKWENEFRRCADESRMRHTRHSDGNTMDFEAFSSFLASDYGSVYSSDVSEPVFDRPLNEYFISSSHNTYLRGWQVVGESSTDMYATALIKGCRCVEIDCWNGKDGQPRVTHGNTGTTKILFADCVSEINRYAFINSDFPVFLSLEVHCDPEQQLKMTNIMKSTFGEKLVLQALLDRSHQLPSPDQLKGRILVKVKKASENTPPPGSLDPDTGKGGRKRSVSSPLATTGAPPAITSLPPLSNSPSFETMLAVPAQIPSPAQTPVNITSASSAAEDSDSLQTPLTAALSPNKKKTSKIVRALGDLGVYLQGYKYRSATDLDIDQFNHIFSLNEQQAGNICKDPLNKRQFEHHNQKFMSRVYPVWNRVDSSNFDPNTFWRRGVQMVALNWQTYDWSMQMNQAMFGAGTDQYGFVLKPDYMRPLESPGTDTAMRQKPPKKIVRFAVEVVSAQQLPRLHSMKGTDTVNPFVEVQIFIAEDKAKGNVSATGGLDSSQKSAYSGINTPYGRRTDVRPDNGYNPQFNEAFELRAETRHPSLVFVRFSVYHAPSSAKTKTGDRVLLGVFTGKLSSLREGYRHLPLYNHNGEQLLFSTIFCKIRKEEPVTIPFSVDDDEPRSTGRSMLKNMLTRNLSSERSSKPKEQFRRVIREIEENVPSS